MHLLIYSGTSPIIFSRRLNRRLKEGSYPAMKKRGGGDEEEEETEIERDEEENNSFSASHYLWPLLQVTGHMYMTVHVHVCCIYSTVHVHVSVLLAYSVYLG